MHRIGALCFTGRLGFERRNGTQCERRMNDHWEVSRVQRIECFINLKNEIKCQYRGTNPLSLRIDNLVDT